MKFNPVRYYSFWIMVASIINLTVGLIQKSIPLYQIILFAILIVAGIICLIKLYIEHKKYRRFDLDGNDES